MGKVLLDLALSDCDCSDGMTTVEAGRLGVTRCVRFETVDDTVMVDHKPAGAVMLPATAVGAAKLVTLVTVVELLNSDNKSTQASCSATPQSMTA